MKISIDISALEAFNKVLIDNVDPKYADLVDPSGIDGLKKEIANNPELQKIFNIEE